jgi:hypothetical protein
MELPPKGKRVLAWVEGEKYPFVGYCLNDKDIWYMEVGYLNCDTHINDIFGEVIAWSELPRIPNT